MQRQNKTINEVTSSAPSYAVQLYTAPETALLFQTLLPDENTTVRLPEGRARWARLTVFCSSSAVARRMATRLRERLRKLPPPAGRVCLAKLPAADWRENWKRFFPLRRVSPRLVVCPPWRDYKPRPGECVIKLNPGLSFGTGLHPTTRGCLRLLDEFAAEPGLSFLDLGCGSGILAIAAALLGCRPVLALDNDPQAVKAARQNRRANGLDRRLTVRQADVLRLAGLSAYDVVAANLLAGLLIEAAPRIAAVAQRHLIVAGILRSQYAAVRRAYNRQGFREIRAIPEGEWLTGGFIRR
ncbi:MAG: 50S ribosomal protein L11 methyltransferase [Kiritimatiellia bacterium]|jgi:ribosomal protein L11 methyltransferase